MSESNSSSNSSNSSRLFIRPVRRILTNEDLAKWQGSATYEELVSFVEKLAESVRGKTNDAECEVSSAVTEVLLVLDKIEQIVAQFPVVKDKNSSRFGKVEFRDFYDEVRKQSSGLLLGISGLTEKHLVGDGGGDGDSKDARTELCVYLNESWGNRTRIDYGSGHELNFMCFLLCLTKLDILHGDDDAAAIVLKIFTRYISLMRILQQKYWLEPAGSHGVWGLDDYHFLPFLFGASQLAPHPHLRPKSIHNGEYVEMFKDKYMYFHCIWFINQVKTASLRWHSPMLDDISGVKTWQKISEGMVKMYKAEVLAKLPIIQHFFFGSILRAPEGVSPPRTTTASSSSGHHQHDGACTHGPGPGPDGDEGLPVVHQHSWGDCCGIKLPSAIAAREMEQSSNNNNNNNNNIRPIPFD